MASLLFNRSCIMLTRETQLYRIFAVKCKFRRAKSTDIVNKTFPELQPPAPDEYLYASDEQTLAVLSKDMLVYKDFLSEEEEHQLLAEIEPYMKRLRYEYDHWDDVIHGYRETERKHWTEKNKLILEKVRHLAFPASVAPLSHVHILDLAKDGYIKPHIDAVRFCGNSIAGLCLLSSCVMKLVNEKEKEKYGNVLLLHRSLYVMKDRARFEYTHEVLPESESVFKGQPVPRDRRMSVICRNEPSDDSVDCG